MEEKEFYKQYGETTVIFKGYYKYFFTDEDGELEVSGGGNSDDMYRADLRRSMTVNQLNNEFSIRSAYLNGERIYKRNSIWD